MNPETRVLIIDDEPQNVRYLSTILEENGVRDVFSAGDGLEGLARIHELRPDLIVLDIRMPKKNGIQVFNELRKNQSYQDIPVIILTGEGEFLKELAGLREYHEDQEAAEDLPTEEVVKKFIKDSPNAFLEKPIEPEPFMGTVRAVMGG